MISLEEAIFDLFKIYGIKNLMIGAQNPDKLNSFFKQNELLMKK